VRQIDELVRRIAGCADAIAALRAEIVAYAGRTTRAERSGFIRAYRFGQ